MVGSGIASSLVHEVGHQGAALLDLVNSLRPVLQRMQKVGGAQSAAWRLWERWISEIVADFWSVSRVGIASTTGLLAVVSLPRVFVFRAEPDDPHPMPWIRVKLSCAMGQALYPHPQWGNLGRMWESFYPLDGLDAPHRRVIDFLEATMPRFVELLVNHRPLPLRGKSLKEVFSMDEIRPERLAGYHKVWGTGGKSSAAIRTAPPTLVFAVVGQARADGKISPEEESDLLEKLLSYWAVRGNLDSSAACSRLSSESPAPAGRQLQRVVGLVAN
jgi:hypothetical protein